MTDKPFRRTGVSSVPPRLRVIKPKLPEQDLEIVNSNDLLDTSLSKVRCAFVKIPRLLLADKRISMGAKVLISVLAAHDMKGDGMVYPSNETLVHVVGRNESKIVEYKRELEKHGWLRMIRRYSKSTLYFICIPVIKDLETVIKGFRVETVPLCVDDFCFTVVKEDGQEYRVHTDEEIQLFEEFFAQLELEKENFNRYKEKVKALYGKVKAKKLIEEKKRSLGLDAMIKTYEKLGLNDGGKPTP